MTDINIRDLYDPATFCWCGHPKEWHSESIVPDRLFCNAETLLIGAHCHCGGYTPAEQVQQWQPHPASAAFREWWPQGGTYATQLGIFLAGWQAAEAHAAAAEARAVRYRRAALARKRQTQAVFRAIEDDQRKNNAVALEQAEIQLAAAEEMYRRIAAAEAQAARLAEALGRVEFQSTIHGGDSDGDGKIGHFLCPDCGADAFAGPSPTHRDWCHIAAALAAYRQQQEAQHGG